MSLFPDSSSSSSSSTKTVHSTTLKVKRKCGRPRNPIPRHKRESHINAEHRRRGKIQNGFQTLKNIVPQEGETQVIRDSKADILFKAVEHSKKLQAEYNEQRKKINELCEEIHHLKTAIELDQKYTADERVDDTKPMSMDDRLEQYIQDRKRKNWKFWIFSFFIRPLFESYNSTVTRNSLQSFITSVLDWATRQLSLTTIRTSAFASLLSLSSENSMLQDCPGFPEDDASMKTESPTDMICFDVDNFYPDKDLTLTAVADKDVTQVSLASEDSVFDSLTGIDVLIGSDLTKDLSLSAFDFKDTAFGSLFGKDLSFGPPSCKNMNDFTISSLLDKDFNFGAFEFEESSYTPL